MMEVTITISDEFAAQLEAEGPSIQAAAQERFDALLARLYPKRSTPGERGEAVEAIMRFAGEHKLTLGGSDLKSTLHEGHKC